MHHRWMLEAFDSMLSFQFAQLGTALQVSRCIPCVPGFFSSRIKDSTLTCVQMEHSDGALRVSCLPGKVLQAIFGQCKGPQKQGHVFHGVLQKPSGGVHECPAQPRTWVGAPTPWRYERVHVCRIPFWLLNACTETLQGTFC